MAQPTSLLPLDCRLTIERLIGIWKSHERHPGYDPEHNAQFLTHVPQMIGETSCGATLEVPISPETISLDVCERARGYLLQLLENSAPVVQISEIPVTVSRSSTLF